MNSADRRWRKDMLSVDQIKPFIPANRVNRREKSKDSREGSRKQPGKDPAQRKQPPRGDHRVDELA
jgi:hypothetical protein